MPFIPTAFHRVLEPLDRRVVARIVAEHDGNRGVGEGDGAWTCQRHLKALLFAQFAGLNSLREIEQGLSARPGALYHLGLRPAKRSTLSDASACRPAAVFRDLGRYLMATMDRKPRQEGQALVELIDASPIPLRDDRFTWPQADARVRGLKLYVHFDLEAGVPTCFDLTSPKTSDTTLARATAIAAGVTYVFDKGFADYARWYDIHQAGAVFVTRLKKNAVRREVMATSDDEPEAPILADNTFKVGHEAPRGGARNPLYDIPLREILVERDDKQPLHLVTNDLERTATEIARLYKQRWQIELFFKWIKQNLRIKSFLGRSENAVRIQLYIALIAFVLLRLLKRTHAKAHKGTIKNLLARIKVALLDPIDLTDRTVPPPRPPRFQKPKPQLELAFK